MIRSSFSCAYLCFMVLSITSGSLGRGCFRSESDSPNPNIRSKQKQSSPASKTDKDGKTSKQRKTVASKTTSSSAAKTTSRTVSKQSKGEQPRLGDSGASKSMDPAATPVHDKSERSDSKGKSTPAKPTGTEVTPPVQRVRESDWLEAFQSAGNKPGRTGEEGDELAPPPSFTFNPRNPSSFSDDIADELHMKLPDQSLTGANWKAMREAMARAVPAEQRDKLRGIHEGFLGLMINCSAELFLRLNAFFEWKDKENEKLKHAWGQIPKTQDAIIGETAVQRRYFETQINALSDNVAWKAEDLVKLGQALEQESVARDAMRQERDQALLDGQRWKEGSEASEKLKSEVALAQKHQKEALDEADVLKAKVETLKKSVENLTLQLKTPRAPSADEVIRIEQNAEDRLKSNFFEAFELMVDEGEVTFYQERFIKRLNFVCLREEPKKAGQPSPELDVTPTTLEDEENAEVAAGNDGEEESKETPTEDASLPASQEPVQGQGPAS